MAAASALAMVGVDCAAFESSNGGLDKTCLVQRIGVNSRLHALI